MVLARIQALVIESRRSYLSGIVRILRLVDREPYDDEDTFWGNIVKGWSGSSSPQLAGEWIEEGFEPARF